MTGTHSMTFSPWSLSTSRSTPCVEGCWGPMLRMSSSVSSPSSLSMTGNEILAASSMAAFSRSIVVTRSTAFEDLFAEPEHALGERFGTGRAPRHIHVDRDDRVHALERRVAVPELAAGARAVAHRDHPLRLGHLLVQPAQPRGHLVGHRAGHDHHVGLPGARAEHLG